MMKSVEYHTNHHNINQPLNSNSNLTQDANSVSFCNVLIFVKLF